MLVQIYQQASVLVTNPLSLLLSLVFVVSLSVSFSLTQIKLKPMIVELHQLLSGKTVLGLSDLRREFFNQNPNKRKYQKNDTIYRYAGKIYRLFCCVANHTHYGDVFCQVWMTLRGLPHGVDAGREFA